MPGRKKGEKPVIEAEARNRIAAFVRALEGLQSDFGICIAVQDDVLRFRDLRRKDDWEGYGEWDAGIYDAGKLRRVRLKNLEFENFDIWGQ